MRPIGGMSLVVDSLYRLWRRRSVGGHPFIVCSMFTPSYRDKAERLAASLDRFELPYALYELPSVHRSISARGGDDIATSKPCFINFALRQHQMPVLYMDADMVARRPPDLIGSLCGNGMDFAIYNWLADPANDAWHPNGQLPHLWKFFFAVNALSETQLVASGAVQFWRNSPASESLLQDWEAALGQFPRAPDDQALDFAFNNGANRGGFRAHWLPKAYVRYVFWPYEEPVLDHPDFPAQDQNAHFEDLGMRRVQKGALTPHMPASPPLPRGAILDAQRRELIFPNGHVAPLLRPLYL